MLAYRQKRICLHLNDRREILKAKETVRKHLVRLSSAIREVEDQISSVKQSYQTKKPRRACGTISEIAEVESRLPVLSDRIKNPN